MIHTASASSEGGGDGDQGGDSGGDGDQGGDSGGDGDQQTIQVRIQVMTKVETKEVPIFNLTPNTETRWRPLIQLTLNLLLN